ncbi:hypothetical protein LCGC14_0577800 [marine sediment metagenome]|uniref:Uncharacterized protein n=1 Tax=marine sediment metagenome TaxID=412755 RepID=A0A0F9RMD1_9ZZZZ
MREMAKELKEGNAGDHTEGLKEVDEKAITEPELVNTVEERLKSLNELVSGDEPEALPDGDTDSTPDPPDEKDDVEIDEEVDEIDDGDPTLVKDGVNTDSEDGNDVTIPDAYVRAAIHNGMKQEDVDFLVKQDPKLALSTFTSMYNSVTNASKEWSQLGRAKVEQERAIAEADSRRVVEKSQHDVDPLIGKLKETYGDDPLIEVVTKLLADRPTPVTTAPVSQPADLYQTATARANASANASTDARVNVFFGSNAMKPYEDFYGMMGLSQSFNDLSNGQQEHRLNVMQEAEYIMTGLRMRGIDLPVEQVLEKAHLVVTEPIREQVIRENLKKNAVTRKKAMTFRPSKSKKTTNAVVDSQRKPQSRQELLSRVEQRLAGVPNLR